MGAITHKSLNEKKKQRQDLRSTRSNTKINDKDNSDDILNTKTCFIPYLHRAVRVDYDGNNNWNDKDNSDGDNIDGDGRQIQ